MKKTDYDPHLSYEVWCLESGRVPPHEPAMATVQASFRYFQEALDFRDYAVKRGVVCWVRTLWPRACVRRYAPDCPFGQDV